MAPKRSQNAQSRRSNMQDSSGEGSLSQDTNTTDSQELPLHKLQEKFKAKNLEAKTRHREREKANELAHHNRVKEWQDRARFILTEHEETIRAIERPKIHRLIHLRKRKRELQRAMNQTFSAMDKVHKVTMQRLTIVLEQRLEDLVPSSMKQAGGIDGKATTK